MRDVISQLLTRQFLLFLVVGGGAALLHWIARIVIDLFTSYMVALLLAYGIGIAAGYILNAAFVFSSDKEKRGREIALFSAFNIAMLPVVIAVSWILSELIFPWVGYDLFPREVAHAIGVVSPVFFNFFFHKFVTFKALHGADSDAAPWIASRDV